jgi:hypothetical protein
MDKYVGNDNSGKPKSDYLLTLETKSLGDLEKETKDKIWLSAYANNNPRSDYHWHVDACYDEIVRRFGSSDLYSKWYNYVVKGL